MRAHALAALLAVPLAGCSGADVEQAHPEKRPGGRWVVPGSVADQQGSQTEGGISLFGLGGGEAGPEDAIGVNRHLWRAAVEVLSVLPLASADAYGGVVITDWSIEPERPDERTKVVAVMSGIDLAADGLRVTVHLQRRDGSGDWLAADSAAETARSIEDSILARARQMRIAESG